MVTRSFACPNGHHWRDAEDSKQCPICGAEAETVGNGNAHLDPTDGQDRSVTSRTGESGRSLFGRYDVIEELGRGGMGIVYRVFDPIHQRQLALKTLPTADPTLLSRFKREFRVLADLDHCNVVKLFELTSDGTTWFFTMEMIDGTDLLNYIRDGLSEPPAATPSGKEDESDPAPYITAEFNPFKLGEEQVQRIRHGFAQLAGAIAALHAGGLVHRDVKPTNVLVTPDGRVVLLDFGLVVETDQSGIHQSLHQQVLGTAAYMSPEQAACDPVSSASDWYSMGVMLYQSLTGQLPFAGKVLDILVKKQHEDPPPPRGIEAAVPQDLNDLCLRMLSRCPDDRPGADEILQKLGEQELGEQVAISSPADTLQTKELALVGREGHLRTLHDAWQVVQGGQAMCVFVEGRSGNGKSALVGTFLEQTAGKGAVTLQGRCYEMESVPFKAIDSLVDSLVAHLRYLSRAEVEALMPRDIHALARLFPVIEQVEAVAALPRRQIAAADQQELNRRAIGALRELFARMGDRCPLVIFIDDLQWGDEDSAAMLTDLLQPPDPPILLFLGTYRSEDAESSPFLQSFRLQQRQREKQLKSLRIEVAPLEHADAVQLALTLLDDDDADARHSAESIAQQAAGNPFFVLELVKHLQLVGERMADVAAESSSLVDMIWSRVERLSEESRQLLAVVALGGQPLPLEQALQIADVEQAAVGALRAGHFIRTIGLASSPKIETYHDRVREAVSQRLDNAARQRHHLRIAREFARQSSLGADEIMERLGEYFADGSSPMDDYLEVESPWYEVAFHFDAAGRSDLAFPYALATAEKAREQFSLEVAEQQFRIAERGVPGHGQGVQYRIAEGLGDVLMLRGKYSEAAEQFATARKRVGKTDDQARIEGKIGELAFKGGNNKLAAEALERSLRLLGRRIPNNVVEVLPSLAWEVVLQTLHTMFPKLFLARRSLQNADQELLAARLHDKLGHAYFFERGKIPCLWTHLRSINLAERYPPTRELGFVWASHAPVMSVVPWFSRGEVYAKKSLEIRKELGDLCGQGQSLHYLGVLLFAGAKYDDCISVCREAISLLERTGDFWERNMAWWQSANAVFRKGDLAAATTDAKQLYEACVEIGDDKVSGFALDVWSRASGGRVPPEITRREMETERNDVWATALVLLAEAVRLVGQNELDEAIEILNRANVEGRKLGMNAWVSPILPWLATTYRLQWERSNDSGPHPRRQLLRNAGRAARQGLAVARKFQTDLPHALREAGMINALRGLAGRARKDLDESLEIAERQDARFEYAQTLLARGRAGLMFDWPEAAEEMAAARQALIAMGAEFALGECGEVGPISS